MNDFAQPVLKKAPRPGSWASTNFIQRFGLIGSFVLYGISLFSSSSNVHVSLIIGLCGWSSLLFGYVAGSLWSVRHALNFWWSIVFACGFHACLLPVYAHLIHSDVQPHAGKEYMYLSVFLVIAETLFLIFLLKRTAMWIHRRTHQMTNTGGPFQQEGLLDRNYDE
jgi:hypothetical protein